MHQDGQGQTATTANLQHLFEQATLAHRQGSLAAAERIYGEILRQQPQHFEALHRIGIIAAQTGQKAKAVELFQRAIAINPKFANAHSNLGNALLELGNAKAALESYDTAVALDPNAEAHNARGMALQDLRRLEEAVACYDQAIALNSHFSDAHYHRANCLVWLGRLVEALNSYDVVTKMNPAHAEAYNSRGKALQDLNRPQDALVSYDQAVALKPDYAEAYYNRANLLRHMGRLSDAVQNYSRAIAINPNFAEAYSNRGNVLQELRRLEEALSDYDKALALTPESPMIFNNRGNVLQHLDRPSEALASYDKAIAIRSDSADAYSNRGSALVELRRFDEALQSYDKAIALKPDNAGAHNNRSQCLLEIGRLEEGWLEYEWRKKLDEPVGARSFPQPLWLGDQDISGKTLFLHWEQGFGDTLQFCRYARLALRRAGRVIMSVQQPLHDLLSQFSPSIEVINENETPPEFDCHCPLMSLPLAFRTNLQTIPAAYQYIEPHAELTSYWEETLPRKKPLRIGLVWSGSSVHKIYNRSMPLEALLKIVDPRADWICLQKELKGSDPTLLERDGRITFLGNQLEDFNDTASLVALMDLVITIDTSTAHLAGALGKPVWILLPYHANWRWLLDRSDSPWYPSARLFRQRRLGDWDGVLDEVRQALQSL